MFRKHHTKGPPESNLKNKVKFVVLPRDEENGPCIKQQITSCTS